MTSEHSLSSLTQHRLISSVSVGEKPGPGLARLLHGALRDAPRCQCSWGLIRGSVGKDPRLKGSSGFMSKCVLCHVCGSAVLKVTHWLRFALNGCSWISLWEPPPETLATWAPSQGLLLLQNQQWSLVSTARPRPSCDVFC